MLSSRIFKLLPAGELIVDCFAATNSSPQNPDGKNGKIFVLKTDKEAVLSGAKAPEPLVILVSAGDRIKINLTNEAESPVSFWARMLSSEPDQFRAVTMPKETRTYTLFAHTEVGPAFCPVLETGSIVDNPRQGLYVAIVMHPRGATFEPVSKRP